MLSGFNKFLLAKASGRTVMLLLAVTVVSFGVMAAVLTPAFQEATDGLRPFDLNFGVSAEGVYRDLPSYTDRSRMIYVWFAFVDYVYPAAAAAFFMASVFRAGAGWLPGGTVTPLSAAIA